MGVGIRVGARRSAWVIAMSMSMSMSMGSGSGSCGSGRGAFVILSVAVGVIGVSNAFAEVIVAEG